MNKAEMYTALQALPRYGGDVGSAEIVDTNIEGDNQYRLTVRVIDGNMIDYQHFFFWVIDDGGPGETAYFEYRDTTANPGGGRIDIFGT